MSSASVIGVIAIVAIIASAFGSYYVTSNPLNSQISSYQSVVSSMSSHPSTTTFTSTSTSTTTVLLTTTIILTSTITATSISTTTSSTTYYPIPNNVTVIVSSSGAFMNYAINAGSYSTSGSLSGQQTFSISPTYQSETISISTTLNCPGSTGPTGSAYLYVNSTLVSQSDVACGGTTTGNISYVL